MTILKNDHPSPSASENESIDEVIRRVREITSVGSARAEIEPEGDFHLTPASAPPEREPDSRDVEDPCPTRNPTSGIEPPQEEAVPVDEFVPMAPASFAEAQLTETQVESLILKFLMARGDAEGRLVSDQVAMPFQLVEEVLSQLKHYRLVAHKGSATMNDYVYQLTDLGTERARRYARDSSYYGASPVSLKDYIASVAAQSLQDQHPSEEDLHNAFSDLLIQQDMLRRLGPAINSGRGLFLFGAPGNGKTSIAERVTGAFGKYIWIPKAIGIDGDILRVYDPIVHEAAPTEARTSLLRGGNIDQRWIRIKRPTIVVGGELTMENLEVTLNTATGICEAPLQMKSNCGTLVIDDFGRQRMSTDELLNRWIIPLEKRYDFLNLPSGKKIKVPFDQLVIFSTNLEPRDLVDEAFLRRIPYKIEAVDPTEEIFRKLFEIMAPIVDCEYSKEAVDHVVEHHYKAVGRPFRNCQPRDLLLQIRNLCLYEKRPAIMTPESMDFAVANYFSVM